MTDIRFFSKDGFREEGFRERREPGAIIGSCRCALGRKGMLCGGER